MTEFHMSTEESTFAEQHFQQLTKSSMNLYITISQAKEFMLQVELTMDTMKSLFTRFFKTLTQFSFNDFGKMLRLLSAQEQLNVLLMTDEEVSDKILSLPGFQIVKLRQTTQIPNSSTQNMQSTAFEDPSFWERDQTLKDDVRIPLSNVTTTELTQVASEAGGPISGPQSLPQFTQQPGAFPGGQNGAGQQGTLRPTHSYTSFKQEMPILIPADNLHALSEDAMLEISRKQAAINTLVQELQDNDPSLSFVVSRSEANQLKKQIAELSKAADTGFDGLFSQLKGSVQPNQFETLAGLTEQATKALVDKLASAEAQISDFYTQFTRLSDSVNLLKMNEFAQGLESVHERLEAAQKLEIDLEKVGGQYEEIKAGNEALRSFVEEMDAEDEEIKAQTAALEQCLGKLKIDRQVILDRVKRAADSSFEAGLTSGFQTVLSDFGLFREYLLNNNASANNRTPEQQNQQKDDVRDDEFWGDIEQNPGMEEVKTSESLDKVCNLTPEQKQ